MRDEKKNFKVSKKHLSCTMKIKERIRLPLKLYLEVLCVKQQRV